MSLTLFFIVIAVAVSYFLYDKFKKSKQKTNKTPQTANNRLKINYTRECTVLTSLSKEKMDNIKTKTISIHLHGGQTEPAPQEILKATQILRKAAGTRRIYLLQRQNFRYNNLFHAAKQVLGTNYVIPYHSTEGAVAILRQLSCGLHLETQKDLYMKIKQYINKIWYVGEDPDLQALREFKTQVQMLTMLEKLNSEQQNS